MFDDKEEN